MTSGGTAAERAGTSTIGVFRHAAWGEGRRGRFALTLAGFCGHQLGEVLVPVAVGLVIDRAIAPGDPAALVWSLLFLVAAFGVLIWSWQLGDRVGTRVFARGEHALRQRTLRLALRRGHRTQRTAGEVLTISSTDAGHAAAIVWVISEQAAALTAVLVACIVLLGVAWPLAVAVVVGTLVQALIVHLVSGGLRRRGYEAQKQAARLDAVSTDFATGLRVLEGLGGASRATARYREESARAAEAAYRADRATASLTALNSLVSGIAFAGIAALGGWLALEGAITVGGFVTAMGLAQTIRGPLQTLGSLPAAIAAKHGSARRVAEFAAEAEDVAEASLAGAPTVDRASGGPVSLTVREHRIDIPTGRVTGIRCTPADAVDLARLLGARRAARPGELVVGGVDASELDADALRSAVFAPPHDAVVFSGTAGENIADRIDETLVAASAFDEVLHRLPDGLDERVGERGMRLSGGQRQRLLLARALHQPQEVLVLHEPTTAMDPITEAEVAGRLAGSGRTIVLLTDRPSLLAASAHVHDLREGER